ncbi:MAG: hypothetical protein WBR28_07475 [Mycobacterium sp.]
MATTISLPQTSRHMDAGLPAAGWRRRGASRQTGVAWSIFCLGAFTVRPFRIDAVYLFDAHRLRIDLGERGVNFSEATSVRAAHWDEAEIYPRPKNPRLIVSEGPAASARNVRWRRLDAHQYGVAMRRRAETPL